MQIESPQLIHCNKTQRVCIFKLPPLSTSKGFYLDDWKQMIWQGGCKVTQKNKQITVSFIDKDGKIFAKTKIPKNHKQAISKTLDSSRGYAVRLDKPGGGYLWIGVVFRDRNDAFDFGVIFQDFNQRQKLNCDPNALKQEFGENVDFSLKKGQKIKVNISDKPKTKTGDSNFDFFNQFNVNDNEPQKKKQKKPQNNDWFSDFQFSQKKEQKKKQINLLDF